MYQNVQLGRGIGMMFEPTEQIFKNAVDALDESKKIIDDFKKEFPDL